MLADGGDYRNDQLVVATGGRFMRRLPGVEHALIPCEGIAVGEEIARRLKDMEGGTVAVGFATNPNEQGACAAVRCSNSFSSSTPVARAGTPRLFQAGVLNPSTRPGQRLGEKCRVRDRDGLWVVGDSGSFPGPDWLPKQAHQADLQAKAAAQNIAAMLKGRAPTTDFKPELICIVDTLDSAMLVYRSETRSFIGPMMKIFHWLKRYFEGRYLRAYR